ncbi:glycosyltransferase family 4 protein [Salinicoccus roseus]|uniref:glycosyltransferase family 4 protein n=1 Tax=Salinicoccus roseus TaxID=45670 RepID=UPI001CA64B97|nr:glycosyltransferase family 4 protein [Salinicoccus roseus]MBY8908366.1 glycosyltransferase family 4 protein [Salinicoccus roseus]
MKILHWDEMFHPNFGYQINVLPKYQVEAGHEVTIMTSENIESHPTFAGLNSQHNIQEQDKLYERRYGVKIIRLPIHGVLSGRVIYKRGYINKIKNHDSDIVFCHTNDTLSGIRITQNAKKIGKPIIFDNHMLEMASNNKLRSIFRLYFKVFVTPIIKKNKYKIIKTQDSDYVNTQLGIPRELTPYISFGTDTSLFYPNDNKKRELRREYNIEPDAFVIIYTGKLTESKGGKLLGEVLKKPFETKKNVVAIVVGNTIDDYGKEVEKLFLKSYNKIIRLSTQDYQTLPNLYQMADLGIFPKQCSLSFFDMQACGLPVVAEENEINNERLSHNNGAIFKEDNTDDFRKKIEEFINMDTEKFNIIRSNSSNYIVNNYDYNEISKIYNELLELEFKRQV